MDAFGCSSSSPLGLPGFQSYRGTLEHMSTVHGWAGPRFSTLRSAIMLAKRLVGRRLCLVCRSWILGEPRHHFTSLHSELTSDNWEKSQIGGGCRVCGQIVAFGKSGIHFELSHGFRHYFNGGRRSFCETAEQVGLMMHPSLPRRTRTRPPSPHLSS